MVYATFRLTPYRHVLVPLTHALGLSRVDWDDNILHCDDVKSTTLSALSRALVYKGLIHLVPLSIEFWRAHVYVFRKQQKCWEVKGM
jgi:hypothetical protein